VSGATAAVPSQKFSRLVSLLQQSESAVLAFSGGVDSSFLLKAMRIAGIRFLAVTGHSETVPDKDLQHAVSLAREEGAEHLVIRTEELSNESFVNNPPDRCFFCKEELFGKLCAIARKYSFRFVFDGSNSDDLLDYRPGRKAAETFGVRSPLAESGLNKNDIRLLSRQLGLKTWNRPSSPCLSSRFPYGQKITLSDLKKVELAEDFLRALGLDNVRVRVHGDSARIEVDEKDIPLLTGPKNRRAIVDHLRFLGFTFVTLDLEGFRTGSLNRTLSDQALKRPE
jgi:uncharacterized protein